MKDKLILWFMKKLARILYKSCRLNKEDLLLAREISAWQDTYDSNAPTVYPRPLYPQKEK